MISSSERNKAAMSTEIELIVFETEPRRVAELQDAGFSSFIVDLEYMGKDMRQLGFDTEINRSTPEDIRAVAAIPQTRLWARLNSFGDHTRDEVEGAIESGANVVVLPMVRSLMEVEQFTRLVDERAEICAMMETPECVAIATELERTPITSVYFGLNDYAIATSQLNIFQPIRDGVIQRVREALRSKRFGFGGLTHTAFGHPVPSIMILHEFERLDCQMTFLRRSFRRDLKQFAPKDIFDSITESWAQARGRSPIQRSAGFSAFCQRIDELRDISFRREVH